jgi:glycosyltransferase involved in cell wall biosynthesis
MAAASPLGIVSTFPPAHCGVGRYAEQQAHALEQAGRPVRRLDIAPMQKQGWTTGRGGSVRALFAAAKGCPDILVQFQVWMFRDETRRSKLAKYLWPQLVLLALLLRHRRRTTMVVHESRYRLYEGPGAFLQYPLVALLFWLPARLVFHTPREVEQFRRTFRRRRGIEVRPHHADFQPQVKLSRTEARQRLGVPAGERTVLCIGFYKVHKGFLPFARAFAKLHAAGRLPAESRLRLVVSLQDDGDGAARDELALLQREAAGSQAVQVEAGFQDDEAFDTWISAADVVALPYLAAFSSGVAARARILGRPLLVRDVGGLADQAGPDGAVYRSEAELEAALGRLLAPSVTKHA